MIISSAVTELQTFIWVCTSAVCVCAYGLDQVKLEIAVRNTDKPELKPKLACTVFPSWQYPASILSQIMKKNLYVFPECYLCAV